jgi:NOL1/NOP2/sun family putative RNA methylase
MPRIMPNWEEIRIKEKFKDHYSKLTDWEEFKKYSLSFLRRSIRVNTLKCSIDELKKRLEKDWELTQIPWCKEGFWIEHKAEEKRRDIGNILEHTLGYFYAQEAVSMIPPIVLDPKPGDFVLDMCASPGSKATQIAQYMENKGMLIANDFTGMRMKPLDINIQRMGITNAIVTLMHGANFRSFEFDKVLVDAPCSGTGTIRKSLKTLLIWNPKITKKFSMTQKKLLETGFNNLKKGGTIVYSTCSLEPEEDEEVVSYLLDNHQDAKIEEIKLPGLKSSIPVLEFQGKTYNPEVINCLRLWPQDNDTEGFFVAKIRKL